MVLESLDLNAIRERSKKDLYFFSKGVLQYDWLVPHIHADLCRDLQDRDNKRMLIELPRGWLKTTLCSICYPIWRTINDPNLRILLAQNSSTNACKKLSIIRGQWETNALLRALFPELLPGKSSRWSADALCLTRSQSHPESTYEAAGTRTKLTSRHYNIMIEDDTVAPDLDELGGEALAPTQEDVEQAIGWHKLILPLMVNPMDDESLIVGTRWYDHDLISHIKENEPNYKVTTRACREDEEGMPSQTGEITYPERFDARVLQELEAALGPYMFSCLYLNQPVRSEDMLFKPEWINYYETRPRTASLTFYTTVDPATDPGLAKTKDTDYSVVMTCAKDMVEGRIYVIDYFREKCNPGEMASAIFDHVVKYRPTVVGYEDIAYQKSLDYWLKELMRQQSIYFVLEPIQYGRKSKDVRISALQPLFASGSILLRSHMKELVSELIKFPLDRHDDIIDALSMQLQLWATTKAKSEYNPEEDTDPMSFQAAVDHISGRSKIDTSGVMSPEFTESFNVMHF